MRDPWYSVPDVQVPDFFLTYMSGRTPSLVRNSAAATCTNTVHSVRVRDKKAIRHTIETWGTAFVRLSCELEGHPLGGGMLKLEPREATQIVFPILAMLPALSGQEISEAVSTLRTWSAIG
jgi:adenine-specific DNA-methyltransferase